MRIALVTGYVTAGSATHADPRGQAVRVATLASTLASLGHQVTVYARKDSPARPGTEDAGGVRFEYLPAGPAAALSQDRLLPQLGAFSSELAQRWKDLIDLDAGPIATGEKTIEQVGWELFQLMLDVASGRKKTLAEHWKLHNALVLFNPAPVT